MSTAALILAGGKLSPELAPVAEGATNRALIPLAPGRVMLDYVVDALRTGFAEAEGNGGGGGRILIAGDVPTPPNCVAVPGGETLVETLLNGVAALAPSETRLLVATADIPFLTADAVADLLQRASAVEPADFVYPIVEAARCRERFPTMKRTTLRIAEGEFTGGNVVLLNPAFLRERQDVIRAAYARRKDVPRLAMLLGPSLLLRFALSRLVPGALTVPHLEAAVGRLLGGARARAVITPFAEIGVDIDRPEDVGIARQALQSAATV